jgi:Ca2+-binding EF-hand superfamily protein
MKKFLVLSLLCVAATLSVQAQKAMTDEQKALKKEMLAKYDTNKDGKLSKDELASMTPDEKTKWKKLFPHTKKADKDAPAATPDAPTTTPAPVTPAK